MTEGKEMFIDYKSKPQSEPTYEVHIEKDLMVPMRDGVHLATDVYRPSSNGKPIDQSFPVLLERTPYDKSARGTS
ncbi:MAG: CocE/NonD family hydrolase, partial [Anaerolineales bacterium]|nr:CocE/NonD family hydrolase [Anaerolineales bacterium]